MHINLTPQRRSAPLTLARTGDVLTMNGEEFDFSALADGEALPAEATGSNLFAAGTIIERISGELYLSLVLPIGAKAPEASRQMQTITVTEDGPVTLPDYNQEDAEA